MVDHRKRCLNSGFDNMPQDGSCLDKETRIKATRCETLRTVTINNSKNTHI